MSIRELIKKKETTTLELKPSLSQIDEIIETVSAFSNTKGGVVAIGVANNGRIIGVDVRGGTIERLSNKIIQNTDPKVYPEISIEEFDKKKIILIRIKENTDKLVWAFGRSFKRVGSSTVKMPREEYERRVVELEEGDVFYKLKNGSIRNIKDILIWADKNGSLTNVTMLDVNISFRREKSDRNFNTVLSQIGKPAKIFFRIILRRKMNLFGILYNKMVIKNILEVVIRGIDIESKEYFIEIFMDKKFLEKISENYDIERIK